MKFRCLIGFHKWAYTSTTRKCECCQKSQHLDEEAARDWAELVWVDDEPK